MLKVDLPPKPQGISLALEQMVTAEGVFCHQTMIKIIGQLGKSFAFSLVLRTTLNSE